MPGPGSLAQPKPERRRTVKALKARAEAKVKASVRAQVAARDGGCRYGYLTSFQRCAGRLEWAHLSDLRRFKTRGQAPEQRHTTAGSLMLCTFHHQQYDEHRMTIEPLTATGADGTLRMRLDGLSVLSVMPHAVD